ncbi:3793_t:CDS:2, partial [Paraglomus occultum]
MGTNPVRIGCYSAFWGDSVTAAEQLVSKEKSNLNYLVADYLAEVTMGLLARRKANLSRNLKSASNGGYISEFITLVIARLLPDIHKHNIKVITNAGGLDPVSCKLAIEALAADLKIPINVAAITGDDLLPRLNDLRESQSLKPFSPVPGSSPDALPKGDKQVLSLNAYLGAIPIARALDAGAQIVVTGRIVDSALVVGPLIHEFNWMATDYDKLASASLAGHIIECGAQATGGNYTDWEEAAFSLNGGYANMGYPIVECYPSGEFLVTKPSDTGGVVNVKSVTEQMLYEVLDPAMYILPDVILDLTRVKVEQVDETRVRVSGARGKIPTELLKVSGIYVDGYKMTGEIVVCGIDAWKKSVVIANAILSRTRLLFVKYGMKDFRATNIEPLGAEHTYGPHARTKHTREVVLRLTVHHDDPQALKIFAMELVPVVAAATSMVPGITGGESGRPHPSPNLVHFSSLVPKGLVTPAFTTTKISEN